jgi:D-beta-D-heptose 7-phosphate kinase/D-beta-D-heptose 1-phosphate adenosyltransferase
MLSKRKVNKKIRPVVVVVSGGFDPIHVGHVRMFREARALGDKLVVVLNNDNWLKKKKGFSFMPEKERAELIKSIKCVDEVIVTQHPINPADMSVCKELAKIRPDIFANGGDRNKADANKVSSSLNPEQSLCLRLGIKMVYNVGYGGKVQSSSWLLSSYMSGAPCVCGSGKKYKECHGK